MRLSRKFSRFVGLSRSFEANIQFDEESQLICDALGVMNTDYRYVHESIELSEIEGPKQRGWIAKDQIKAGTLLIRETSISNALSPDRLPFLVLNSCLNAKQKLDDLKTLSPPFPFKDDNNFTMNKKESYDYVFNVCDMNATQRTNVDDFALHSFDPLTGRKGYQRSLKGNALPAYRSLMNHSCHGNTVTLHLKGGVYVRAIKDLNVGDEVMSEYLAGIDLLEPSEHRQGALQRGWGFKCSCSRCLQGDPCHIPPTSGWLMSAGEAMGYVAKNSPYAPAMLKWLLERQRKHANNEPSYAEGKVLYALAHTHASAAFAKMHLPASANTDSFTKTNHSLPSFISANTQNQLDHFCSLSEEDQELVWQELKLAWVALSETLPILERTLSKDHPAFIPPLLSKACLMVNKELHGENRKDEIRIELVELLNLVLRIHNTSYGGGLELFTLRYGSITQEWMEKNISCPDFKWDQSATTAMQLPGVISNPAHEVDRLIQVLWQSK